MSFTKVYRFQDLNGYESVISKGNSEMKFMGFGRILLKAGQTFEYEVVGEEHAVVLQSGDFTVTVEYDGKTVIDGEKGVRGNVYDDLPTAFYAPPRARVRLYSENGMEARVFTAYCEEGNAPYFCPPENVEEGEPGEYIYKRKYRYIFGQPGKHNGDITRLLIVGESVSVPGGWIGFPAHRHTVMDGLGNLIYFPLTILLLPSCLDISDSMTIDGKAYGANKILEYIQKRDQDYVILLKSNMCNH